MQEHGVSWATVLRNNMLSICISDKQHETSDLPSENEAKAQKSETLLQMLPGGECCWYLLDEWQISWGET